MSIIRSIDCVPSKEMRNDCEKSANDECLESKSKDKASPSKSSRSKGTKQITTILMEKIYLHFRKLIEIDTEEAKLCTEMVCMKNSQSPVPPENVWFATISYIPLTKST